MMSMPRYETIAYRQIKKNIIKRRLPNEELESIDLETVGKWAERERAVVAAVVAAVAVAAAAATAVDRRPRTGLDVGDALPLT